jgi:hypothetical protein
MECSSISIYDKNLARHEDCGFYTNKELAAHQQTKRQKQPRQDLRTTKLSLSSYKEVIEGQVLLRA